MQKFTQKLMVIDQRQTQTVLPSAIFGSIGNIQGVTAALGDGTRLRIGLWPCVNAQMPQTAMGLWTVFGHLLDQYRNVRVYRLFTRIEDDTPDDRYTWDVTQSQFDVDDYALEYLDENIAIWGQLAVDDGEWVLTAYYENDLTDEEEDDPHEQRLTAHSIAGLIAGLPDFVAALMQAIDETSLSELETPYDAASDADESLTKELIETAFRWENRLLLTLWGVDWDDADILTAHRELQDVGLQLGTGFAAWLVAKATARAMLPGLSLVGELLVDQAERVVTNFDHHRAPAIALGNALYRLGYADQAYKLLENDAEGHPNSAMTRYTLAALYWRSGRDEQAVATMQAAIETNATNAPLYILYARAVTVAEAKDPLEEFVLVDPAKYGDDVAAYEAMAAYEAALQDNADDVRALLGLADLTLLRDEKRFWEVFEQLVRLDKTGDGISLVIESLYNADSIEPAIEIFERALAQESTRADLHVNLAAVYLIDDMSDEARAHLETAQGLTDDPAWRNEIERMLLLADDPDFEMRFSDIVAVVDAGNKPSSSDMDYLEGVVEDAPNYVEGYLTLARAYASWDDNPAALELLLDAQKQFPDNPDVLGLLGQQLLNAGEAALAMQYLNQGLQQDPNHVPLLVTTGSLLFDSGYREEARAYLTRAEAIAPRHPDLWAAKTRIANKMAEEADNTDD